MRHRTTRTRNRVSRATFLGLAFELIDDVEKTWRRINGPEKIKRLLAAFPSETVNRCKTINGSSENLPHEITAHRAFQTSHSKLSRSRSDFDSTDLFPGDVTSPQAVAYLTSAILIGTEAAGAHPVSSEISASQTYLKFEGGAVAASGDSLRR